MVDLSYHKREESKDPEPEEIVIAILVVLIWIPMAFVIGGLL